MIYIESRLQAIKEIATVSCTDKKDADNICDFCDEIHEELVNIIKRLEKKEDEAILKAPNTSDLQNPDYQKWMMKSYGFKEAVEILKGEAMSITEREAIEELHKIRPIGSIIPQKRAEAIDVAINALEKQEKIKEAFEKWRTESGGYIYADADDEDTELIRTLNQILRSDKK